ncbi:aspartate aminotransferase [Sporothrix schenckii 1099-18]|uniref:Aspartate aminotransferase n=1 Tax=Sporothrix schenckii 1099-18 TaxID=1397361 RepID=A0A0F2MGR7_SPOSC|nr:aspartate aminotransferase [Sporothrix schenckii 1099-18]KJR88264.1 aspartate aminotransferase [Sporothrix schenckii 1099-18]
MGSVPIATSHFAALPSAPRDEIFALLGQFRQDTHPDRVNLGAGVYCSDAGEPWPLDVVRTVEQSFADKADPHRHDYIPIEGDQQFLALARDFVFGDACDADRLTSVQTVSGSGANHVGARFLAETLRPRRVWLSAPTWANHELIWKTVGVPVHYYPYYNAATRALDFAAMVDKLEAEAAPNDVLLLHACAHNPTGLDPTQAQWRVLAELCQRKGLFPFFDNAYQGFASGDPDRDAWAIRHFAQLQPPVEMCVAQSFAKNLGLYGHRAGAFHLVATGDGCTPAARDAVTANLAQIIRSEYSVSPRYGADIVKAVLGSKALTAQWHTELQTMSGRIRAMRRALFDELVRLGTPGKWVHIIDQIGMFSYTGLSVREVNYLRETYHIYIHSSGRISIAGLNTKNVKYVAAAIHAVRSDPSLVDFT